MPDLLVPSTPSSPALDGGLDTATINHEFATLSKGLRVAQPVRPLEVPGLWPLGRP